MLFQLTGLVIGKVFIDCSYEGDLLRLSGTDFAVGRESRDEYNESLAGKDSALHDSPTEKPSLFDASVSPFIEPADLSRNEYTICQPYNFSQAGRRL